MVVDGYVRVSRSAGRSGDRVLSPTVQREQIEAWARRNDGFVAHVFEELDESGGRSDRPLLLEAVARVERGDSQGIVVAYLSRFGRSLADGLNAIKRITDAGGAFITVDHGGLGGRPHPGLRRPETREMKRSGREAPSRLQLVTLARLRVHRSASRRGPALVVQANLVPIIEDVASVRGPSTADKQPARRFSGLCAANARASRSAPTTSKPPVLGRKSGTCASARSASSTTAFC